MENNERMIEGERKLFLFFFSLKRALPHLLHRSNKYKAKNKSEVKKNTHTNIEKASN